MFTAFFLAPPLNQLLLIIRCAIQILCVAWPSK